MHDTSTTKSDRSQQSIFIILLAGLFGVALVGGIVWFASGGEDTPPEPSASPAIVFKALPSRSESAPVPTLAPSTSPSEFMGVKDAPIPIPNLIQPLDRATFLGTQAEGRRFCIIADASQSMRGAPMDQLKAEILKTLNGLSSTSQFYVIFFNATDIPMPYPNWLNADKENLEKVRPWVKNMTTVLKTLPQSSFQRAFKLQPKPDVIFFMTDGFLQGKESVTALLGRLNATEPKTQVHTILFSKPKAPEAKLAPAAAQLRTIAEKNAGTFRSVRQK
jgi:von Willebrand factor type A domain